MTILYRKFRAHVKRNQFILDKGSVLVGTSGGLDSMVLAHLLLTLTKDIDFVLSLAHVNYGLRGAESEAQEKLVQDFARQNRLDCFVSKGTFSFQRETSPRLENFQQAARNFRYHFFEETALQMGASKIAVAHHLEDQVETVLAQWLRGASLKGLSGMRPEREMSRQVKLIRPLLLFSKEDLRKYAASNPVSFIEDSSNASPKYWRNRLRHELSPVIKGLRPRAFEKIVRVAGELKEMSEFMEEEAKKWLHEFTKKGDENYWFPRPRWLQLPRPLRLEILYQAIAKWSGSAKEVKRDHLLRCEQLSLGLKTQGYYSLPGGFRFTRRGDDLLIS